MRRAADAGFRAGAAAWATALAIATGCARGDRPPPRNAAAEAPTPPSDDSLLLGMPHGIEIWATLRRQVEDSTGGRCVERALEIRDGHRRTRGPLLYPRDPPIRVNDSTIRARLWTHCRPGDAYLVNLKSGQPVRAGK
ncbi:MAG TPA: hypothetical protein VFK09_13780 [Gemmatimonadales bacterium]|nr:hypothetical protein [Gemmatimonadales bacterium]